MTNPKVLAFVLPQYHRIPENDKWWGEGFTEWTNVRKARPQFPGHRQPRVPLDDRYYDLLDESTREWQAELARTHGIAGFCYYHYWFNGKQLLEKPVAAILERGKPDFPFCIAWANEPWTRTWDGGVHDVLMPQSYGNEQDWQRHYAYLEKLFLDPRYIRVGGRPLLLIYRTASIERCGDMLTLWQKLALQSGLPGLHVASMLTYYGRDERANLFDAYVEFEPNYTQKCGSRVLKAYERIVRGVCNVSWRIFGKCIYAPVSRDYRLMWREIARRKLPANHYPGAFVDWDNSPRKNLWTSLIMRNVSVDAFSRGFSKLYAKAARAGSEYIFINAWNEWAEGAYLEPDTERGTAFLEVIRSVVFRPDK
jgi:lipopolysaccharide biosynthesis protein